MKLRTASLGIAILMALSVSWCSVRDDRLEANFSKILPGMSVDQVRGIMGSPSWDGQCGAKIPTGLPSQCTREFGYAVTLAPVNPSYYLIWFGNDERVLETAPITSP
jgi:hypothetical protein